MVAVLELQKTQKKAWWILEFEVEAKHEEMASWLMIHIGANGCQWISTQDGNVTLQASFELAELDPADLSRIYAALDEYGLASVIPTIRINKLEEEDWLLEWKKGISPLPLGERLLICPPWLLDQLSENDRKERLIIQIEPGMAFGTGFHFTTQFCLRAMEQFAKKQSSDRTLELLDVGTGSGILAIAAVLLLKNLHVWACEIDVDACVVARENLELNEVADKISVLEGSVETVAGRTFDLVLSNLTCEDNVALLKDYVLLSRPGTQIIMSGILREKLPILERELANHPFKIVELEKQETWAGVVVERV